MKNWTYAERAFAAYCKAVGGKTYDGKDIPGFWDLTPAIRDAWYVAAQTVIESVCRGE